MGQTMDRPRSRLSALTSQELTRRAIEYRRLASESTGPATIKSLNLLAARFAVMAAKREVEETSGGNPKPHRDRSEFDKLVQLSEKAATGQPDPVRALADIIKLVSASDADPYLVMGVLIEGAVSTLGGRIPKERHEDTASAILQLLADRLNDAGLLRGG
jgi:hypothetical protein